VAQSKTLFSRRHSLGGEATESNVNVVEKEMLAAIGVGLIDCLETGD
jgi:hypothetical protein